MRLIDVFARNLHALRIRKHLSQEMLTRKASVSVSYISMLERSQRSPPLETIAKMAKAIGVEPLERLQKR